MSDKLLTVIVPSFNMEEYLPKCLESLLVPDEELLQSLDVIVVNDGSKDKTSEIAHGFEARFPDIFRVVDKRNGNYGSCINAALPLASGFYVKVLDADDSVATGGFTKLLSALETEISSDSGSADLVVTDYESVNSKGTAIERIRYRFPIGAGRTLNEAEEYSPRFTIHSIVYKTDLLRKPGYRQSEGLSYTDTEWITEPMAAVNLVTYLPFVVTRYLVGRSGQTMEDATFATRFQQVVRITEGLVSRFPTISLRCVPVSRTYYKARVIQMVSMVYQTWLLGWHGHRVRCNLRNLDRIVRETPEIRSVVESFRLPSRIFPLRYVAARLRPHGLGFPLLSVLHAFLWARRLWHRVRDSFRQTEPKT